MDLNPGDNGDGLKHVTAYFRKTLVITNTASIHRATVQLMRDDGAQVYLNGREIIRENLPPGEITEHKAQEKRIPAGLLHQRSQRVRFNRVHTGHGSNFRSDGVFA